jgi:hypothetical protein
MLRSPGGTDRQRVDIERRQQSIHRESASQMQRLSRFRPFRIEFFEKYYQSYFKRVGAVALR